MIPEITKRYRTEQEMTLEKFGEALGVSKQAVNQWESGETSPSKNLLKLQVLQHGDWRLDWALACLAILEPELYGLEA